jgi:hypothetical protein
MYLTNQHVERLAAYQPFDANFNQLYAEYVDTLQSDQLSTRAFDFVMEVISDPDTKMVVLTGDAGHGKTHLCGRVLSEVEAEIVDPRMTLAEKGQGQAPVSRLAGDRDLYIIKDLSELRTEFAVERLIEGIREPSRVTIVCANEGRLREVLSQASEALTALQASLDSVLTEGRTTADGSVHVIDLNHQSVATRGERSLTRQVIRNWSGDNRKWTTCDQCDARDQCPIFENHRLLAANSPQGESRREGVVVLLRAAEQTGHVVTIRELLILMAHAVTGGLRCGDVHERLKRRKSGWQSSYLFHQTLFGDLIKESDRQRLRVFRATSVLDPGTRSLRPVDDALFPEANPDLGNFLPDEVHGGGATPKNYQQQKREAERTRETYVFLRRQAFFEAAATPDPDVTFAERLGLRFYDEFERVLGDSVTDQELVPVRDAVLQGLEAVQGARRASGLGSFMVVDSAFASHRGAAAVIARRVMSGTVKLISQTEWWRSCSGHTPNLDRAVDWNDRKIYVVLGELDQRNGLAPVPLAVDLDCGQFEFVCRAGHGLTNRAFFQADIRRIMAQLAKVADGAAPTTEISVLLAGRTSQLVIDVGDVIQVAGV